jgi:hypothetical protein
MDVVFDPSDGRPQVSYTVTAAAVDVAALVDYGLE